MFTSLLTIREYFNYHRREDWGCSRLFNSDVYLCVYLTFDNFRASRSFIFTLTDGKRARSWIHRTVKFDDDATDVVAH